MAKQTIERNITEEEFITRFTSLPLSKLWSSISRGCLVLGGGFHEEPRTGIIRIASRFDYKTETSFIEADYRFREPRIGEQVIFDSRLNKIILEGRTVSEGIYLAAERIKNPDSDWLTFLPLSGIINVPQSAQALRTILPYIIFQLEEGSNKLEKLSERIQRATENILRDYIASGDLNPNGQGYWLPQKYLEDISRELKIEQLLDAQIFEHELYHAKNRTAIQKLLKKLK